MNKIKIIQAKCATSSFVKRLDIFFDEDSGLITKVSPASLNESSIDYFYNDDYLLFAGMGDIHIHAREDISQKNTYKEDFQSASRAALSGGLVHVGDMPNNPIPPIDDQSYLKKLKLTEKVDFPFLLYAGIGPLTKPLSFKVPYKVYMGPSVGELFFKNNESLDKVLEQYTHQSVSFHCEDPEILEQHKNELSHNERRPPKAEIMATTTAISLIKKYALKGKLCHYSTGDGLAAIIRAKKEGVHVTCEVTPQHLYFSEEKLKTKTETEKIFFQMNPPIRKETDRIELIEALKKGHIDFLATDHAPHTREEKEKGMSGLPGLDTYGGFVTWLLCDQGIDPQMIAKVASEAPGLFFNQFIFSLREKQNHYKKFGLGFGFLLAGYSASFSILNLKKPMKIKKEALKTKCMWSPFLGETFPGSLAAVFLQGQCKLL